MRHIFLRYSCDNDQDPSGALPYIRYLYLDPQEVQEVANRVANGHDFHDWEFHYRDRPVEFDDHNFVREARADERIHHQLGDLAKSSYNRAFDAYFGPLGPEKLQSTSPIGEGRKVFIGSEGGKGKPV